ncbi:unnamed protein product [Tuber aestivum]|uniref:Uncharacterized protein n=1 Tax=Tuber aestivum TaxID=59557 RepID=A0A292PS75_9PEZI|nr:unnamed protein product [Tuber aestivum]
MGETAGAQVIIPTLPTHPTAITRKCYSIIFRRKDGGSRYYPPSVVNFPTAHSPTVGALGGEEDRRTVLIGLTRPSILRPATGVGLREFGQLFDDIIGYWSRGVFICTDTLYHPPYGSPPKLDDALVSAGSCMCAMI